MQLNILLRKITTFLSLHGFFDFMSDEFFLKMRYRSMLGHKLNLANPSTFNEKIQWLKVYDKNPEYIKLVDKYEVKGYVANLIGEDHVIPTIGVWNKFEDIDFKILPNRFVLKCTHDSGSVVICTDKAKFDYSAAKKRLKKSLKRKLYKSTREWPYKYVEPRIIAEPYLEDGSGRGLRDYKFYVFHGKVKLLYISEGLDNHASARISFVYPEWKLAPFGRSDYRPFDHLPEQPKHLGKMIETAELLSEGSPFRRIDLYEVNDKVLFSEITLFPCGGMMPFDPTIWDRKLGEELSLSK